MQFTLTCYAISALLVIVVGGIITQTGWIGPIAACGGVVGFFICEVVLAALFALLGAPTFADEACNAHRFWRCVCRYTGAFTILSAIWGVVAFAFMDSRRMTVSEWIWNAMSGVIFIWWWINLTVVIVVRARGTPRKVIGALIIPVGGGLAIFAGYWAAVGVAFGYPF